MKAQLQPSQPPGPRRGREYNDYVNYSCALNPWLYMNSSSSPTNNELDEWNKMNKWGLQTRTVADYKQIEQIGEGTYGQVYKAKCRLTGRIVALKKIRIHSLGHYGLPPTIIREIKILKDLRHPNMVSMIEVLSSKGVEFLENEEQKEGTNETDSDGNKDDKRVIETSASAQTGDRSGTENFNNSNKSKSITKKEKYRQEDSRIKFKGNMYIVLEYISHDLTGLMDMAYKFTEIQTKCIFQQLLNVLCYMHENKYVHRDIKCSNILIDEHFRVKLADFGLARSIADQQFFSNKEEEGKLKQLTNKVITLWYRPPEILLGATDYGTSVDMWSAGCILAELILGRPLLPGKTEIEELGLIFDLIGKPTSESWEGYRNLKLVREGAIDISAIGSSSNKAASLRLRTRYGSKISNPALGLIEKLLSMDPKKRMSASSALSSRYFITEPKAPSRPEDLGVIDLGLGASNGGNFHEFQTKKRRKEAKVIADKVAKKAKGRGLSQKEIEEESSLAYKEHMKMILSKQKSPSPNKKVTETKPKHNFDPISKPLNETKFNNGRDKDKNEGKYDRNINDNSKRRDQEVSKAIRKEEPKSRHENSNTKVDDIKKVIPTDEDKSRPHQDTSTRSSRDGNRNFSHQNSWSQRIHQNRDHPPRDFNQNPSQNDDKAKKFPPPTDDSYDKRPRNSNTRYEGKKQSDDDRRRRSSSNDSRRTSRSIERSKSASTIREERTETDRRHSHKGSRRRRYSNSSSSYTSSSSSSVDKKRHRRSSKSSSSKKRRKSEERKTNDQDHGERFRSSPPRRVDEQKHNKRSPPHSHSFPHRRSRSKSPARPPHREGDTWYQSQHRPGDVNYNNGRTLQDMPRSRSWDRHPGSNRHHPRDERDTRDKSLQRPRRSRSLERKSRSRSRERGNPTNYRGNSPPPFHRRNSPPRHNFSGNHRGPPPQNQNQQNSAASWGNNNDTRNNGFAQKSSSSQQSLRPQGSSHREEDSNRSNSWRDSGPLFPRGESDRRRQTDQANSWRSSSPREGARERNFRSNDASGKWSKENSWSAGRSR